MQDHPTPITSQEALAHRLAEVRKRGAVLEREFPCLQCDSGEYVHTGGPTPLGTTYYECDECGHEVSFP